MRQGADWLAAVGGVLLFASLFLTWSHQFSQAFLLRWGGTAQLQGVPVDPTAWQVYSAADVVLAALAVAMAIVAVRGGRTLRIGCLVAGVIALAFTLHALAAPPTNGANIFDPSLSVPRYYPNSPTAGVGETVAILGLVLGLGGIAPGVLVDSRPRRTAPR